MPALNSTPSSRGSGTAPSEKSSGSSSPPTPRTWFALCFKTREDKERFLARAKLFAIGDKYLDGYAVARLLGIPMDDD